MNEDFFIYLTYRDRVHVKCMVNDPNASLKSLMESVIKSNIFDMPTMDSYGSPISYYFVKEDENGRQHLLNPIVNDAEKSLLDYNVKSKDELHIVACLIA